ncbi:hypothetical protein EDD85DRAFT_793405 [Armillaria nabsnona]|nr:hypothetical protein EDD85DRAFT_793405 [Armillaria nabsnona]
MVAEKLKVWNAGKFGHATTGMSQAGTKRTHNGPGRASFLTTSESRYALITDTNSWFGPGPSAAMMDFVERYVCEPSTEYCGFRSWDDFFTRLFRLGFVGGTVYRPFLSATKYHLWHSPVNGKVVKTVMIPGTYDAESPAMGFLNPDPGAPNLSQGLITAMAIPGTSTGRTTVRTTKSTAWEQGGCCFRPACCLKSCLHAGGSSALRAQRRSTVAQLCIQSSDLFSRRRTLVDGKALAIIEVWGIYEGSISPTW